MEMKKAGTLYQCNICKLHYRERILAEKCHTWCSTHESCNLEITRQSIEANEAKM